MCGLAEKRIKVLRECVAIHFSFGPRSRKRQARRCLFYLVSSRIPRWLDHLGCRNSWRHSFRFYYKGGKKQKRRHGKPWSETLEAWLCLGWGPCFHKIANYRLSHQKPVSRDGHYIFKSFSAGKQRSSRTKTSDCGCILE